MGWWGGGGGGEGLPIANYTGRRCPKGYLFQFRKDYSTLFSTRSSTFWHGQAKETNGKNAFKLEKLQSLKVGFVENYRRYNSSISYGGGRAQTCSSPPTTPPVPTILHVQTSVYFNCVTLLRYIFARLRRNTFSFGNVTATEILTCVRGTQKSMSFLYWCDVSEMIVCTKK